MNDNRDTKNSENVCNIMLIKQITRLKLRGFCSGCINYIFCKLYNCCCLILSACSDKIPIDVQDNKFIENSVFQMSAAISIKKISDRIHSLSKTLRRQSSKLKTGIFAHLNEQ